MRKSFVNSAPLAQSIKRFTLLVLLKVLVFFGGVSNTLNGYADSGNKPILRVEVGQHTAMINRMAVDKDAKLLATASDDKTVRLWNLPEGTLYTTLRVPIDERLKGALYAVAISPDGKTVITSGETIDANQKFSLYVFDVEKRVVKARIPNLPSAIYHLTYSKDGKYFAAAFAGGYGIRIWDSQTGKPVAQDADYSERSNWLDFSRAGNLATVSHDGYVRIYDSQFTLIKKEILNQKGKPNSIAFSENGQLLAVGYANLLQVDIADLNLNKVTSLPTENLIGTNTAIVVWQKNSNTALFASGDMKTENGRFVVRHWQGIGSSKSFRDVEVSKNIVTDLISVDDTGKSQIDTLFSSADPSWGSLKYDELIYKSGANLWDARLVGLLDKTFSISEDGLKIAYSQHPDSNDLTVFDVTQLTLKTQGDEELLKTLSPGIKGSKQFNITNWQRDVPIFNGKKLHLDDYEKSLTLAIDAKFGHALIGTNYYLRWYDAQGKEIKKVTVPSEVYGLNIAANGKLAIVALGDGTIRWYSLLPGEELNELVTLFPYNNSKDWIIWTKDGFFGSSDGGGYRLAGYHLNKGENRRPEWIEFSQVYQTYYAPELILPKLLRQEDKIQSRLKSIENADDRFNKNAVPIIDLVQYCMNPKKADTKAFIRASATIETKTSELSYLDKVNYFLKQIYDWFRSLFHMQHSDEVVLQDKLANPSDVQEKQTCYAITGQGQTRGFTRKEKAQTTIYRNQLDKNTDSIELHYVVKPREGGIGDIDIYVNGQIQQNQKQILPMSPGKENQDLKLSQNISLKEGENEISIHAYEKTGGTAAKSDSIALINPVTSRSAIVNSVDKSKLIVLAVGIDRYQSPNELKYAVKDSSDFLSVVAEKKSSAYSDVLQFKLFNEQATLQNIESTFDKIAAIVDKNDSVLIYFSGHGIRDERDFYFIPYGVNDDNLLETALSQPVLKKNIAKLSKTNRIFIFLDSCHSGAVDLEGIQQEVASFDKIKHQLGDNVFILAAAGENQEAQDQFILENHEKADNGLFAYAVLEGLNGKARRQDDHIVDNYNLGSYVQRRIDVITKNQTVYKQKARFQLLEAGDILNFDITQYE